jgi:hypothetical protein
MALEAANGQCRKSGGEIAEGGEVAEGLLTTEKRS